MNWGDEAQPIANVEAEAELLGTLMSRAAIIDGIADRLQPDDFLEPIHSRIFSAIVSQNALGKPATPVTLRPFFENDEEMSDVGGPAYLAQLTGSPLIALVDAHGLAGQIKELSVRRQMIAGFREAIVRAHDLERSIPDVLADADGVLAGLSDSQSGAAEVSAAECVDEMLESLDQPLGGVTCGLISDLDRLLGALQPKTLTVVAGRPGMAKTATELSYSLGAARRGHGTLFVSLEMSTKQLGGRLAADMCHGVRDSIPYADIVGRRVSVAHVRRISQAREELRKLPFRVVDQSGLKVGRLESLIRKYKRKMEAAGHKLELVVIDYFQLLRPDQRLNNSYEVISEISRRLKEIAKAQDLAVVALAQLSRKVEDRPDKRPQMNDLRDSGQIEQDADNIVLLYRAAYYLQKAEPKRGTAEHSEWQEKLNLCRDRIDFICVKRRDGPEGAASGYFFGEYQAVRGGDFYELEGGR